MIERGPEALAASGHRFGQERFLDWRKALIDQADLLGINIDTEHVKTAFGKRGGNTCAELAEAAHRNSLDPFHPNNRGK